MYTVKERTTDVKLFAFKVRGYGEARNSSLTIEATSKTAALALAQVLEYHPTFQPVGNYRKTIVEVA